MNPELETLSITELKALAYDQFAIQQNAQNNITLINQVIAKKNSNLISSVLESAKPESDKTNEEINAGT